MSRLYIAYRPVTPIPPAPEQLLLDAYPNAVTAVSFRKLREAYAGSCLRVRRSSDNTELDIGFSGNYIDYVSMTTFVGLGNGFITKWYDQSGNGNDWTQTNASFQYRVINTGNLETIGGQLTAFAVNGNYRMDVPSVNMVDTYVIHRYYPNRPIGVLTDNGGGGSKYGLNSVSGSSSTTLTQNIGSPQILIDGVASVTTRGDVYTALNVAENKSVVMRNGSVTGTFQSTYYSGVADYGFGGYVFEWVVYDVTQTSYNDIITEQMTYYGIL